MLKLLRLILLTSALLLHAGAQSTRKAIEITQWEYKTVHSDAELNQLANAGWEFVSMASDPQGQHYLLRRSKVVAPASARVVPTLIYKVEPKYTLEARAKGIEGEVVLDVVVTTEGTATDLKVATSLDPGLDIAAIAAVKQWRFQPGTKDGMPMDFPATISVKFALHKQPNDGTADAWASKNPPDSIPTSSSNTLHPLLKGTTVEETHQGSPSEPPAPLAKTQSVPQPQQVDMMRWGQACKDCEERWDRGRLQRGMRIGDVTTWISVTEQPDRFAVSVSVLNDSKRAINVMPDRFSLALIDPPGRSVSPLPFQKVQLKRSIGSRIAGAATGAARGYEGAKNPQKKTGNGTIYSKDGSTSDVDIYGPDTTMKDQQAQAQQRRQAEDQQRAQQNGQLADSLLLANTVAPGGEVDGLVYFPKEAKRYRDLVLTIRVDTLTFDFPWSGNR
jgi:TonB family protein